jgi:hypothetical protein
MGDRFGHQGKAQLQAVIDAKQMGVLITPVWNKSFREHDIIGTHPRNVRIEADEAVSATGWHDPYFVDADHVGMNSIKLFLESSDFFTLDVADFIGQTAEENAIDAFVNDHIKYIGSLSIPGIKETLEISNETIRAIARKFLFAIQEAGRIQKHILKHKAEKDYIIEVSMDETDQPQSPLELFFILAAIAREGIPAQTIAPKFTGRFNKGVDYVGDLGWFASEFEQDLAVIDFSINEFGLSSDLKLSVHSGSDKFAIYPLMRDAMRQYNAGLHLKTAGTTWLEELIGLAEAEGKGLEIVKEIYISALDRFDELCEPYVTVIDIQRVKLPDPETVKSWDGSRFARTLRHNQDDSFYNPNFRQILHVGYKIAAEMGNRFLDALNHNEESIARNVSENLLERHIRPLFL